MEFRISKLYFDLRKNFEEESENFLLKTFFILYFLHR